MSTRSGEYVTLRQVREEVGNDARRFLHMLRKMDQALDFDLDLAKSQSNDNPVHYVQYAHARICLGARAGRGDEQRWHARRSAAAGARAGVPVRGWPSFPN